MKKRIVFVAILSMLLLAGCTSHPQLSTSELPGIIESTFSFVFGSTAIITVVTMLVNLGKVKWLSLFGNDFVLVKDGTADQWHRAILFLLALASVVYKYYNPTYDAVLLESAASVLAVNIQTFFGFALSASATLAGIAILQPAGAKVHLFLRGVVPLIGKTHTK